MIRLKKILLESKVGHLVEKEETLKCKSTKSDKVVVYKSKDARTNFKLNAAIFEPWRRKI